jgi:hypothetical protein
MACLDRGLHPRHLDSYLHVYTEPAIGAEAITIAPRYGILAIRLARNCGPRIDLVRRCYKLAYKPQAADVRPRENRYFGSSSDIQEILVKGRAMSR